jgi:putative thymidine phosphorylase
MKLKVNDMGIATGRAQIVILNKKDAATYDLHPEDRIFIKKGKQKTIAILDVAESKAVPPGRIGMFKEVVHILQAKQNDTVSIELAEKPQSFAFIKKKLGKEELNKEEIYQIVQDIVDHKLSQIELTTWVIANYMTGMSVREIVYLTEAMTQTGIVLGLKNKVVGDLHSIGGVPGNRMTMITIPICVAAGVVMPKTSSRAITSPAGTADTMEVFAPVVQPIKVLKNILQKIGGFIVWGGAINLAPADEMVITVESPLQIDAEGQMIASIMAKKASVNATHLVLEIPYGVGAKIPNKQEGERLGNLFSLVGEKLGIKVKVVLTDGSSPIGNGIGPALEAKDVLLVLHNDAKAPSDLRKKSLQFASHLLEFTGKVKKGEGLQKATEILESGKALKTFTAMVNAQGGKMLQSNHIQTGKKMYHVTAHKKGILKHIDNYLIAKLARLAGAPQDKGAGIYLFKKKGDAVVKGEKIFTIYAHNAQELDFSATVCKQKHCVEIQ